jgi:hypothetical protein
MVSSEEKRNYAKMWNLSYMWYTTHTHTSLQAYIKHTHTSLQAYIMLRVGLNFLNTYKKI